MSLDINLLRQMHAQDSSAIQQLKQLLIDEREQLAQRKQDQLSTIAEQKTILVDQLNHNSKQRTAVLNALNLPTNAQGWDLFLQRNTATLPLREDWQRLVVEFEECQQLNDINGKLIARSQQTLNHLLNLLRGKVATASLYTAQGLKSEQTSSFTVAKA
ncbi:flagella synthesis protein FlgN [Cellvibrio fontiphilus]|jgi:flagella synthesis protein FlgN|uniref:Flagella synthesis protein FlgN n=1 Tax=Cellvibrio fontiphilus TaxID=1815559 RepID=A0ABV7FCY5_9GAMM